MRQAIETIVNHPEHVAQVFLTAFSSCQIGEIGRETRSVGWMIILIEANALYFKCSFLIIEAFIMSAVKSLTRLMPEDSIEQK